jgi:hypothetical protein
VLKCWEMYLAGFSELLESLSIRNWMKIPRTGCAAGPGMLAIEKGCRVAISKAWMEMGDGFAMVFL